MSALFSNLVPPLTRALLQLDHILEKAQAHCAAHQIAETVLSGDRLYPDMLPLTSQVYIACDVSKGGVARLAGVEAPSYPDVETSFKDLRARVQKTIAYVGQFEPAQFGDAANRPIVLKLRTRTLEFIGQDYLTEFVLPNVYFHITTCYNILRHNGVSLGKADFLGN